MTINNTDYSPASGDLMGTVDAGSNAIRFSIFRLTETLVPVLHSRKRYPVRLGAGTFATGSLARCDMDSALKVFEEIAANAKTEKLSILSAVATSAIREATNCDEFIEQVRAASGIELTAITGREEARLAALGAMGSRRGKLDCVIIDVGGGSTEVARIASNGEMLWDASLSQGAVRVAHNWEISKANREVEMLKKRDELMATFVDQLPIEDCSKAETMALGGTAGALLEVAITAKYDVNSNRISIEILDKLLGRLAVTDPAAMSSELNVHESRISLILPGAVILSAVARLLNVQQFTVSDAGVREGLAMDLVSRTTKDSQS